MVDYYAAKSSTAFKVHVHPNSRIIVVYCTIANGGPCKPCKEFQTLQSSILEAILKNGYITLENRARTLELRRQINDQHDPLNVFLVEIQAKIFAAYCFAPRPIVNARPQMTLLSICKSWRSIAIESPRLWRVFPVPPISPDQFCVEQIDDDQWLLRSKAVPISLWFQHLPVYKNGLTLELAAVERNEAAISDLIITNKNRIHTLDTSTLEALQHNMISGNMGEHAIWPMLSRITMANLKFNEAIEVLRRCPQAICVEFTSLLGNRENVPQHVNNPCLQVFRVGFNHEEASDPGAFLDYISAPALVKMICQSDAAESPIPALKSFLLRSICALSVLHLERPRFDNDELLSLLKIQPSLRVVEIGLGSSLPYDMTINDAHMSGLAFEGFLDLLLINANGDQGVGREYTTGGFLPGLEVINYVGQMVWPSGVLDNVCSSHIGASSDGYRPLRWLNFLLTERNYGSPWIIGQQVGGWNPLSDVGDIPSRTDENKCRLKCNHITSTYKASVHF